MSLEHILLGMLRDPASGYDLRKDFDSGPRHFWSAQLSQIYPTLQKMEKRGWLSSRQEPSPRGPARRVYRRTRTGTRALHQWLRAEPDLGTERLAYIGQLVFMGELGDPPRTLQFVQQLRERCNAMAAMLHSAEEVARQGAESARQLDDDAFHELLCVRIGITSLQGKIAACDEAISLIRTRLSRRRPRKESKGA